MNLNSFLIEKEMLTEAVDKNALISRFKTAIPFWEKVKLGPGTSLSTADAGDAKLDAVLKDVQGRMYRGLIKLLSPDGTTFLKLHIFTSVREKFFDDLSKGDVKTTRSAYELILNMLGVQLVDLLEKVEKKMKGLRNAQDTASFKRIFNTLLEANPELKKLIVPLGFVPTGFVANTDFGKNIIAS